MKCDFMEFDKATLEKFWRKVDIRNDAECWPWKGDTKSLTWYGNFYCDEGIIKAHRASLIIATGIVGKWCLHSCDNKWCVNPSHLRWGSASDNMKDRIERGDELSNIRKMTAKTRKLTDADYENIPLWAEMGFGCGKLGKAYGLTKQTIAYWLKKNDAGKNPDDYRVKD